MVSQIMARIISLLATVFLCSMASGEQLDFARDVRPVLSDACYHCHGPDAKVRKAKLRLHDRAAALEAGVIAERRNAASAHKRRSG